MIKSLLFLGTCLITHFGFSQNGVAVDTSRVFRFECEIPDVEEAEFPNGYEKMLEYLEENKRNIINPRTQSEYTVDEQRESERVILRFAIDTNGKVTNVVLEVGLPNCEPCNQEALRLVENMPNWKPSKENGKPFYSLVRLPIRFELEKENDFLIGCVLEVDAQFKGGKKALNKYIQKNMKIPGNRKKRKAIPKEDLLEGGRVIVGFEIDIDGSVQNVYLHKKLDHCEPCNEEVLRVIKNMPMWQAAQKGEVPVRSKVLIPILIEME